LRFALAETEAAWRRSYEREPAERGEIAAGMLVGWLAEGEPEPVGDLIASRCG
jgi:hypothetical protein